MPPAEREHGQGGPREAPAWACGFAPPSSPGPAETKSLRAIPGSLTGDWVSRPHAVLLIIARSHGLSAGIGLDRGFGRGRSYGEDRELADCHMFKRAVGAAGQRDRNASARTIPAACESAR
jgi:hypothetical protein